jgi:ornithine decarboxylase
MAPAAIEINEQYTLLNCGSQRTENNDIHHGQYQDGNNLTYDGNLVMNALKSRIEEIDVDTCQAGEENAFYVADMGEVYRQHMRWKMNLSRVKPHYGEIHTLYLRQDPH